MREGERAHLRGGGLDQLLIAVAERRAPKSGHTFEVRFAVAVVDIDALAAFDDERPAFAKAGKVNVGVHQGFDIADGEITQWGHKSAF